LTKTRESNILKKVRKRAFLLIIAVFAAAILVYSLDQMIVNQGSNPPLNQEPQDTKKPKYDYMSTFLSRDTNPLGLKENIALKKLLDQSSIKWAIRSSRRHILN
jgi:hypothetical protein